MFTPEEQQRFKERLAEIHKYHQEVKNIQLLGHRGMGPSRNLVPNLFIENTITSFKEAIILGADGLECDVICSQDGQIMVIHSDELWLHVSNVPKEDSYRVSQKSFKQLKQLYLRNSQEKIPSLLEVLNLITAANKLRKEYDLADLTLNIEIKSSERLRPNLLVGCQKLLTTIINYLGNDCFCSFDYIYFCSFDHYALELLLDIANQLAITINIAPIIRTVALFGKEQVNQDHSLITGAKYDEAVLYQLKNDLFNNYEREFKAYDVILWDVYLPLIKLVQERGKELHTSTSEYCAYDIPSTFGVFLLKMSDRVQVKFKCDDTKQAMQLLTKKAELLNQHKQNKKFLQEQQAINDSLELHSSIGSSVLSSCLPRP